MNEDDKKKVAELIKLEQVGGLPPGYSVKKQGENAWQWSAIIDDQLRMSSAETEDGAKALAWLKFWHGMFGWLPPGYSMVEDPQGHCWLFQMGDAVSIRSFPKASREEAQIEAWVHFKCTILGVKSPPTQDASSDPRSLMARFQGAGFELVGVELELRRLERRRDVLVNEMAATGTAFNEALAKMDEKTDG